jgi:hypothetical protein
MEDSMNETKTPLFSEPLVEIIHQRRSIRTYSNRPVPADMKSEIIQFIQQLKGPFPVNFRLEWLDKPEIKAEARIKLGTYGMIQGASSFIAAAVKKQERNMEQLGYVFENLVLYLTSLGLGTCWLAGTFAKTEFLKAVKIEADEFLPIVTPVGYAGRIRSPIDILIKPYPTLKQRMPWYDLFFKDSLNTILSQAEMGEYALPLEMVRLAPSASNNQPWRIVKQNHLFHFYLAHDAVYSHRYPYDIQKVDMGIAMFHFEATAREAGLKGRWAIEPPELEKIPKRLEYIITWIAEN